MSNEVASSDVIIIGGGIAGLTAATLLARSGKTVTLFEQSSKEIGGRARTKVIDGFDFNQGPPRPIYHRGRGLSFKRDRYPLLEETIL